MPSGVSTSIDTPLWLEWEEWKGHGERCSIFSTPQGVGV